MHACMRGGGGSADASNTIGNSVCGDAVMHAATRAHGRVALRRLAKHPGAAQSSPPPWKATRTLACCRQAGRRTARPVIAGWPMQRALHGRLPARRRISFGRASAGAGLPAGSASWGSSLRPLSGTVCAARHAYNMMPALAVLNPRLTCITATSCAKPRGPKAYGRHSTPVKLAGSKTAQHSTGPGRVSATGLQLYLR